MRAVPLESPLDKLQTLFRAIASTIVPETSKLDESSWNELERIVNRALSTRPPRVIRRVRIFLKLIQFSALLRHGHFFTSLDSERRTRHLQYFQNHSVPLLRVGFWGIRTLVLMSYYGQPSVAEAIGYRPGPEGWRALS
jgi:hypothetical protein